MVSTDVERGLGRGFARGHAALVAYVMAGYPDRASSHEALSALVRGGADVIELGVPYADPVADGPVIASAGRHALASGFGLAEAIELAAEFSAACPEAPPIALMTYVNPLLRRGFERAASEAAEAGVSGFIVPDLPPDQPFAQKWRSACEAHGLDTVFLAAPTSTPARLEAVGACSSGFVYLVSSLGVTGERATLAEDLPSLVATMREYTTLPVAVGFGVSKPEQAAKVARVAEGVVVGSALVRRQHDAGSLERQVRQIAEAVHAVPISPR
ncbi:MAG: tryptophan synthase subunit alpha [Coriobacteriales bacterium]